MNKRNIIIYRVVLGFFTLHFLLSIGMYFFKHEMVAEIFTDLGYPTYIIYPLAVVKLLGLIAIWTRKSKMLKEWAYAGFVFNLILAISAHININDGGFLPATVALIVIVVSYIYDRKVYGEQNIIPTS